MSDVAVGIWNVVARSGSYEKKIETGRTEAINDIEAEAGEFGVEAVMAASFDDEEMAAGMLWVDLSGTAVKTNEQ